MQTHSDALSDLSELQHGVIGRSQVRALGYDKSATYDLWHRSPRWDPISERVARRVGAPRSDGQRLMAAVLDTADDAVVSHLCAARWWGHLGCSLRPAVVSTASRSRRSTALAEVHRLTHVDPRWTTRLDGIPIVRPEMLSMQVFDVCAYGRAERLVEWLWGQRLLSGPSLHRYLDEAGQRGRNGTAGLRRYLRVRPTGYVPAASGLESRAMQLFRDAMLPMRRQVDVGGEHWTGRVDFCHERLPVVVEIQSERHHTALVDVVADERRRKQLDADGYEVVELTDDDVWARPWLVAQRTHEGIERVRGVR